MEPFCRHGGILLSKSERSEGKGRSDELARRSEPRGGSVEVPDRRREVGGIRERRKTGEVGRQAGDGGRENRLDLAVRGRRQMRPSAIAARANGTDIGALVSHRARTVACRRCRTGWAPRHHRAGAVPAVMAEPFAVTEKETSSSATISRSRIAIPPRWPPRASRKVPNKVPHCIAGRPAPASPPQSRQLHRKAGSSTAKPAAPPQSRQLHLKAGSSTSKPAAPPQSRRLHRKVGSSAATLDDSPQLRHLYRNRSGSTATLAPSPQRLIIHRKVGSSTATSTAPPQLKRIRRNSDISTAKSVASPQIQQLHRNANSSTAGRLLRRNSGGSTAMPAPPPRGELLHGDAGFSTANSRDFWGSEGAQACSLGREPQEAVSHNSPSPEGATAVFLRSDDLPSPLRGFWDSFGIPFLGLTPQATCLYPLRGKFRDWERCM